MKTIKTTAAHDIAYEDVVEFVKSHAPGVSSLELVAIASNFVGKLVCCIDDGPDVDIAETIRMNIEAGGMEAIAALELIATEPEGNA